MWFNIDTRGHKKAQKRQNIAVGPEDLKRHMKKHETDPVKHKCRFCGKTFERMDKLLRHAQTSHKAYHKIDFQAASSNCIESLKCQICSLDFV